MSFQTLRRAALPTLLLALCAFTGFAQDLPPGIAAAGQQDIIKQISQAKGRVVLINFWATWCQPCRMELPGFMRLRNAYPEDKLTMLGVSLDQDPSMLTDFLRKNTFNYPQVLGKTDVALGFSIRGIPKTLIYNQKGEMVLNHDGYLDESRLLEIMGKLLGG
ncbi:MAG: TlpA family protein disulfide reductase [Desulfovibrionaceae bacterium]|nr:TlpA family protein disulfide reductase [Desulfovibrionaceae bacterium]MBF0513929.1 TlpA family protein disulfide reductase [Desulfovibrionaceae bacterium]